MSIQAGLELHALPVAKPNIAVPTLLMSTKNVRERGGILLRGVLRRMRSSGDPGKEGSQSSVNGTRLETSSSALLWNMFEMQEMEISSQNPDENI